MSTITNNKWWRNNFITKIWPAKVDNPAAEEEINSDSKIESTNRDLINQFNNALLDADEKTMLDKINGHIVITSNIYRAFGHLDGYVAAKNYDIKIYAQSNATQMTEHVLSILDSKVKGLEASIAGSTKEIEGKELHLSSRTKFREEVESLYHDEFHSREFSRPRAWLYLVFGYILLFADLPLSLNIVSSFGLIKSFGSEDTFLEKLLNPEAMLFAMGIAFCSIYMKILYDEYINTRTGHWVSENGKFSLEDRSAIRWEKLIKTSIKILILLTVFGMLIEVGIWRNYKSGAVFSSSEATVSNYANQPDQPVAPQNKIQSGEETDMNYLYQVRLRSYTLLTFIIPIISGICLSIGYNILHNRRKLKSSRKDEKETADELNKLTVQLIELTKGKHQFESFKTEWQAKANKITIITNQFVSMYNQGYKRSKTQHFGFDLYQEIEEQFAERTLKKLNKELLDNSY